MGRKQKLPKRPPVIVFALVGVLVAGLAGIALAGTDSAAPSDSPSLSPEGQKDQASYEALQQWLAEWDAKKETEASTEAPLDSVALRPSYSPDPWEDSLGDGSGGDFLYPERHGLTFESTWTHSDGSHYWAVYSGASEDSVNGVLLVQRIVPETMASTFLRVETDVKGSLRITGSGGMTISVSSDSGQDFPFDVSTLASNDIPSKIDHVDQVTEVAW